ncbi:MAG: hypothetical protein K1X94_14250 [Sandaracinaceae bacterium]|nr:hypothetical protein [Sandaracinaceae bacterium]
MVHTPIAIARAMVREARAMLARHALPTIGARELDIVDPATGPGVFLAATLAHAPGQGSSLVGLDLDAQANASTRRALGAFAAARGHRLTLETTDALAAGWSGAKALLVIGNPPWSARGLGPLYIEALARDFHRDERGAPLAERRRGVLADAYVRFLRWAIDAIERCGAGGVLAFVTNASYLDGPVHRGVRATLVSRFDEVRVIDLGGSALVARPAGVVDQNVFGVRPGAAIVLAARRSPRARSTAEVSFGAVRGTVADKLASLGRTVGFERVEEPLASLRPRARRDEAYASWPSLAEWFPFHAEGVQTNRDELVIDRDREELLDRIEAIATGRVALAARAHFDPDEARRALRVLRDSEGFEPYVRALAYRPFDTRWAFVHPALCHRPRPPLLAAMSRSRFALVSVRKDRGTVPWAHAALVSAPIDNCYLSSRSSCRARAFPTHAPTGAPNLAPTIVQALRARALDADPKTLVLYVAAKLRAPDYAARHADALALDYARVPLPRNRGELAALADEGRALLAVLAGTRTSEPMRIGHHRFGDTP